MSDTRLRSGSILAPQSFSDLRGQSVDIPDPRQFVHLQFRRFAGCPVCDLHLQTFQRRSAQLQAAGVREVVFFHSSAEALREHAADGLPWSVIADPERRYYRAFGVEAGARALLDPRAWPTILRAVGRSLWLMLTRQRNLALPDAASGRLGLPADFLIARDGRVLASKYGSYVYDQWSVDDVLAHARAGNGDMATAFKVRAT